MLVLRSGRVVEHRAIGQAHASNAQVMLLRFSRAVEPAALAAAAPALTILSHDGVIAKFSLANDDHARAQLLASLLAAGLPVCEFAVERQNMQDAYLATLKEQA